MIKNYKKIIAMLLTAAMTVSLCACGSSSDEQTTTDAAADTTDESEAAETETADTETAPAAEEAGTDGLTGSFSIFHFHEEDGAGTSKAFWSAANTFSEENPDVTIDYQFTDSDNYQEKLTTLMAGDELPDVFLTKGDMLGTLADAGMIQPLDQYIQADAEWAAAYADGVFSDCTYDGTEWGAPFQMQANCIGVYNGRNF